ncbi:fibronectin type III domain-containing protein [Flavobacterium bizetiae]|uniref:fibronectin type III domain-containing protein n=1 Tax=Flavobacterium bizetiae TaxID=2704140 RepID=UPI0021E93BFB|nr:fibronectin type III domain-containing protein [Flavobacterium bizetiae]UTN06329.1 fibronectin type III domain-containing protein [Flavobacterium bizetiae]
MDKSQSPKMLKKLHLYLLLLSSLIGFGGYAQTYPISITTQVTQPSPIYLSNYADATTVNSPIKIQIVLNDLTISNRQVKLKIYFQGNGISFTTNDFVVGARPLYLEGGFPLQLTNVDLAPYFEFQNLLGLNPNQYAQALPEGIYNIYVEVYDFATGKKLSSKTRTNTIIFQNEPPFLNLPLNNASIMQQNIQNIIFSWTPRSINVSNVEYEFSLVEIWDKYTPIQNAFAYSPPLYTTTTRATTLQYSMSEPQLIPGKKYAWRIKAKAILGAEEIGVFKNNGYSEIFSFDYEVSCTPPLAITTSGVSENQAKIAWSGNIDNYDYQVNYREKNANSEWYKQVTPRENITLSNLKPNTVYEYTVGSSCDPGKYTHSTIKEFTTVARDEIVFASCGIKPDPNDLSNTTPLPNLYQNDVVTAGDFPIVVIKATGSNGTFTGEGYVTFPFIEKFRKLIDAADNLKEIANKGAEITGKVGAAANATANLASNTATKVSNGLDNSTGDSIADSTGKVKDKVAGIGEKVNNKAGEIAEDIGKYSTNIGEYTRIRITFNNIGVNTDFKLISGEIIASYDPTWKNIVNLDNAFDEVFGSNGKPIEGKFDYEVVSVVLNADGSTTVTGKDGQISTIAKSPYERVYTDSTGKVVTIPANGAGAPVIANAAAGGKATAANTNGMSASGDVVKITSPDVKITFKNGEKSQYAFDVLPNSGSQKLKDTYETIPMEGGGIYNVNYKAVSDLNGPETFIAEAEFKNGKTIKDVVFKTNAGADVNFKWNDSNTEAVITVTKTLNFSKESIIAIVKGATQKDPQDPAKTIEGKSDIAGKVNLWQLAQKPVINVTILSVNGANAPSADSAKDFLNEVYNKVGIKFDVTAQDLTIGALPAAIQCGDSGLINFYSNGQIDIKNQIEANPNFTYNSETYYIIYTGKPGQDGYKGFMPLGGQYAFVFSDGDLKTAAHELGHGIFGLKHPFATKAESGKTDLLMDYGTGTVLSHNDWDIIHSGGWKFYGFQSSSSGALAGGFGLSPKWELVQTQLSNTYSESYIAEDGFTSGFTDLFNKETVKYVWDPALEKYVYTHIVNGKEKKEIHSVTKDVSDNSWIWLFANNKGECNVDKKYIRTKYKYVKSYINSRDKAGLQKYIKAILDDKAKKEGDKDSRDQVWGILKCTSDTEQSNTNGTSENYNNYLVTLGSSANKGYKEDPTNVDAQESHTYDYCGVILSEKEKLKILSQLKNISSETGLIAKIFFTDTQTLPAKRKEVTDYLANLSGSQIALWIDFDINGKAKIKTILGNGVTGSGNSSVNKFLSLLSEIIPKFDGKYTYFNPLTAILDGVATVVKKAKIPERFYNPEITSNDYNPVLYYVSLADPFSWTLLFGDQTMAQFDINITNPKLVGTGHIYFAIKCGFWNGIIDQVAGLAEMAAIVTDIIDGGDRLSEMWQGIKKMSVFCTESTEDSMCIWTLVKKSHTGQTCQVAETVGYDIANVVTIVISFAKAGKLAQISQVIESLDVMSQTMKLAGNLIKITVKGTGKAARISFAIAKAFMKPGLKLSKAGKMYCMIVPIAVDLSENIDNAVSKAKELLEKTPKQLEDNLTILSKEDVNGNIIAEISDNGEKIKVVLNESEEQLKKSTSEVVENASEAILVRLKKLGLAEADLKDVLDKIGYSTTNGNKLIDLLERAPFKNDISKLKTFLSDINASTDLQDFVRQGKDFSKEWLILEAYPSFRKLSVHIEKISSILAKGHVSVDDLTTILTVNKGLGKRATDLTNFLNDLDHFALYANQGGVGSIISGLKAHWFNGAGADGANWVIAVLRKEGTEVFVPRKTNFEVSALSNTRRYDAIVGETGNKLAKYFEFKSYSKVPPTDFAKQFLGDLSNPDIVDLKQLQWLFDAGKNPPDFASNLKKAIDNLDVTDEMAKKLLKDVENPTPAKLKKYLKEDFDEIFKLK